MGKVLAGEEREAVVVMPFFDSKVDTLCVFSRASGIIPQRSSVTFFSRRVSTVDLDTCDGEGFGGSAGLE